MQSEMPVIGAGELIDVFKGMPTPYSEHHVEDRKVVVRGVDVEDPVVIRDSIDRDVFLYDCRLRGGIQTHSGTFGALSLNGGELGDAVHFYGGLFNGNVTLNQVDGFTHVDERRVSLGFWGGEFKANVLIYGGAFRGIYLTEAHLGGISIRRAAEKSYTQDLVPYIEDLSVAARRLGILDVHGMDMGSLNLSGILDDAVCSFSDLVIHQLVVQYLVNRGHVRFYRVRASTAPGAKVFFHYSQLGEMRFSRVDFTGFESIEITNSSLVRVESSDTKWFAADRLQLADHTARQDIFRQLKHAMISQGNRIDEMMFNALEMDEFRKSLEWRRNPADLLILLFSKYTNNFGTNYVLAALWLVVAAFAILQCSLWAANESFAVRWGEVFTVMNPVHPLDYLVPRGKLTNGFIAIDFLGRVLISVLIYQLVIPFRKFSRK